MRHTTKKTLRVSLFSCKHRKNTLVDLINNCRKSVKYTQFTDMISHSHKHSTKIQQTTDLQHMPNGHALFEAVICNIRIFVTL